MMKLYEQSGMGQAPGSTEMPDMSSGPRVDEVD
jgi:hypothetical protein